MIEAACEGGFFLWGIDFLAVEITRKNSLESASRKRDLRSSNLGNRFGLGYPLPRHPLKALTGAGFAKMGCKILSL